MRNIICLLIVLGVTYAQPYIQLTVDTNRDGRLDVKNDNVDENTWSKNRGAIFFYNNDSDENTGNPDCTDEKINGVDDLLDLSIIQLQSSGVTTLSVDVDSQPRVNLFIKRKNRYERISAWPFSIDANTAKDCELRIEANSYANAMWNGMVKVTAKLEGKALEDTVALKVAPFILLANTRKTKKLYIRAYPGKNDTMIHQLQTIAGKANFAIEVVPANLYPYYQIWMQDTMEIGYTQGVGHQFHVVLPANRRRSLDDWPHDHMLQKNFGWFRHSHYRHEFARGGGENGWLDWYGNLEVSPPLPGYPLGRIYYGANGVDSLNPEIVDMLDRQDVQRPLVKLDTGWLLIKHVDEILSFIPTQKGQTKALVPSPKATIDLLQKWQKEGKGNLRIVERNGKGWTINSLLANKKLMEGNMRLQKRINGLYDTVKKEFFTREENIVYIPALFENGESLIPNMVNSVAVNGHLLMANPNGPKIDGKDLLQNHVRNLLQDTHLQIHFLDDWKYHTWAGNVHCATNTVREIPTKSWWDE